MASGSPSPLTTLPSKIADQKAGRGRLVKGPAEPVDQKQVWVTGNDGGKMIADTFLQSEEGRHTQAGGKVNARLLDFVRFQVDISGKRLGGAACCRHLMGHRNILCSWSR